MHWSVLLKLKIQVLVPYIWFVYLLVIDENLKAIWWQYMVRVSCAMRDICQIDFNSYLNANESNSIALALYCQRQNDIIKKSVHAFVNDNVQMLWSKTIYHCERWKILKLLWMPYIRNKKLKRSQTKSSLSLLF